MKLFAPAIVAAATMLLSANARAEVVKVNVGVTLNPFFLTLTCNKVAGQRGGRVVKSERVGPNKIGVCYIDVPRRAGIVATPGGVVREPLKPTPTQLPSPVKPKPLGELKMIGVGRLWSQSHANERCRALAKSKDGEWTGKWTRHDYQGEEAKCELRIIPKPDFVLKAVATSKIWSEAHARYQCERVAKENSGTWSGRWRVNPEDGNKAICMIKLKPAPAPEMIEKRFRTTKIWNDAHAKQHCTRLATKHKGQWTNRWRNVRNGKGSVCIIKVAASQLDGEQVQAVSQASPSPQPQQQTPSTQNANIRNVAAGDIWDQDHANRKCPVVARNAKGSWTQRWTKIGPGNKSLCEVRFGGGIVAQASSQPITVQPVNNARTRNVAAGQIWDDKQAAKKCPVVAANNKAKWTGEWTKTGPGHTSVCEISVTVGGKPAQSQPAQTKPVTIREVAAGGIWDQAQANRKCPVVAANNKARWTGGWRKIDIKNNAVCEIDTNL